MSTVVAHQVISIVYFKFNKIQKDISRSHIYFLSCSEFKIAACFDKKLFK